MDRRTKTNEQEAIWSGSVKTDWNPPADLFTKSANAIATAFKKGSDSLKQAMSRLNSYINRAGKNLSADRKKELEKAKDELRKVYGVKESVVSKILAGESVRDTIISLESIVITPSSDNDFDKLIEFFTDNDVNYTVRKDREASLTVFVPKPETPDLVSKLNKSKIKFSFEYVAEEAGPNCLYWNFKGGPDGECEVGCPQINVDSGGLCPFDFGRGMNECPCYKAGNTNYGMSPNDKRGLL